MRDTLNHEDSFLWHILTNKSKALVNNTAYYLVSQAITLGLLPSSWNEMVFMYSQKLQGDVTIFPRPGLRDYGMIATDIEKENLFEAAQ